MKYIPHHQALFLSLIICACLSIGADAPPRNLVQQANQHYQAGRYAEALELYRRAADAGLANAPEVVHNQAAALYHLDQRDEARALWQQLAEQGDARLEAPMRYNLGNCAYADALDATRQQDLQSAVEHLQTAQQLYREALQLDPTLEDARANLELAQQLRTQLEQLQQQQQQQQGGQQGRQDQQNQNDQQQPSSQPSQSQQQQSQQNQQQSSAADQQQSDTQQQQSQEQQAKQDNPKQPEQPEQQSAEQRQAENQPATTQPQSAQATTQPVPIEMTREQAERLLQMVRDAEKARREELARRRAAQQEPVERDW